jgi:putative transposase
VRSVEAAVLGAAYFNDQRQTTAVRTNLHWPAIIFPYVCTLYRHPLLANEQSHEAFVSYCRKAAYHNVAVGRYVLMPDHVHLFVRGAPEFDVGIWVRGLKRALSSKRDFWQPGFFDHILRGDESYERKWSYVRDNPVRLGVVPRAEEWPFQGEIGFIDRV